MTWKNPHGKSRIIRDVVNMGFSFRKAERAVNAVFALWARTLQEGDAIELPSGIAAPYRVRRNCTGRRWRISRNISTGEHQFRPVPASNKTVQVRFIPYLGLDLRPTPDLRTLESLHQEALEWDWIREILPKVTDPPLRISDELVDHLNAVIDRGRKPGSLWRRLHEIHARGWTPCSLSQLEGHLRWLYWL